MPYPFATSNKPITLDSNRIFTPDFELYLSSSWYGKYTGSASGGYCYLNGRLGPSSGGLLMQWGRATISTGINHTIYFPISFQAWIGCIHCTSGDANTKWWADYKNGDLLVPRVSNPGWSSTSSFTVMTTKFDQNPETKIASPDSGVVISWMAIGY